MGYDTMKNIDWNAVRITNTRLWLTEFVEAFTNDMVVVNARWENGDTLTDELKRVLVETPGYVFTVTQIMSVVTKGGVSVRWMVAELTRLRVEKETSGVGAVTSVNIISETINRLNGVLS